MHVHLNVQVEGKLPAVEVGLQSAEYHSTFVKVVACIRTLMSSSYVGLSSGFPHVFVAQAWGSLNVIMD